MRTPSAQLCAMRTLFGMSSGLPVAAAELRRHLRDHLDGVSQGRSFEIARNGRVVAVLVPPEEVPDEEG
jgi:hypothetical protein